MITWELLSNSGVRLVPPEPQPGSPAACFCAVFHEPNVIATLPALPEVDNTLPEPDPPPGPPPAREALRELAEPAAPAAPDSPPDLPDLPDPESKAKKRHWR
jgi:hypothetical protein